MFDKAYNILGPVNSSVVYSLSTGISVRESTFDFWFSLWRSTLFKISTFDFAFWLLVATVGRRIDEWWAKRKIPWALPLKNWNCREQIAEIEFAVNKLKLPWVNCNCREQIEITCTVSKLQLPWTSWNCREKVEITVSKLKLPWANWNCRE